MMLGNIVVISGNTGSGKSTLCNMLLNRFNSHGLITARVISFSCIARGFSKQNGFDRVRDCYFTLGLKFFSEEISKLIIAEIKSMCADDMIVIVDGLYCYDTFVMLSNLFNIFTILVDVPYAECITRISRRLSISFEDASEEYTIKESIKNELGNKQIISHADCVICGTESKSNVAHKSLQAIENYFPLTSRRLAI